MKEIRVALCGIGGYGEIYLEPLLKEASSRGARLIAGIDPAPERCQRLPELKAAGIELFPDLESFFAVSTCDLLILCSPIQFHCEQVCLALARGCHVLCEKPLCATDEDAERMANAERASGKTVTVGYQWSFSDAIQRLKSDILSGCFGKALQLKTLICWPRGDSYYQRNDWAGAIRDSGGRIVRDSPVNNAAAHYLHNMFYLLGPTRETSAWPARVEASLYRANPISNYDTAALRIKLGGDTELQFFASHATKEPQGPILHYEFEHAVIRYDSSEGHLRGTLSNGILIDYGCPDDGLYNKLWHAIASARDDSTPICGIESAWPHVRCVALAQAATEIIRFPSDHILRNTVSPHRHLYVTGLQELLTAAFEQDSRGEPIDLNPPPTPDSKCYNSSI